MKNLAFQIANRLLNLDMIVEDVLPSRVESVIVEVLRENGVGVKKVHFYSPRYETLCRQACAGVKLELSITKDPEKVTCLRCRKSMKR